VSIPLKQYSRVVAALAAHWHVSPDNVRKKLSAGLVSFEDINLALCLFQISLPPGALTQFLTLDVLDFKRRKQIAERVKFLIGATKAARANNDKEKLAKLQAELSSLTEEYNREENEKA